MAQPLKCLSCRPEDWIPQTYPKAGEVVVKVGSKGGVYTENKLASPHGDSSFNRKPCLSK